MTEAPGDPDDASTPLTHEELNGLIPTFITLRRELNAAEQSNIEEALEWASARPRNVLDERFLNNLHGRMFGNVWRWASKYRTSSRNIGVDPYLISQELRQLLGDVSYWVEHQTYAPDVIAARFHHRLVWIHPYPNGNGRHARLAADLLLISLGCAPFSWGQGSLVDVGETRHTYVAALRAADARNYDPLFKFVRS